MRAGVSQTKATALRRSSNRRMSHCSDVGQFLELFRLGVGILGVPQPLRLRAQPLGDVLLSASIAIEADDDLSPLAVELVVNPGEKQRQPLLALRSGVPRELLDKLRGGLDWSAARRNPRYEIDENAVLAPDFQGVVDRRAAPDRRQRQIGHLDLTAGPIALFARGLLRGGRASADEEDG